MRVIFFVILTLPGHSPIHFEHPMESLAACHYEVLRFTDRPPDIVLNGGQAQAGCVLQFPRALRH